MNELSKRIQLASRQTTGLIYKELLGQLSTIPDLEVDHNSLHRLDAETVSSVLNGGLLIGWPRNFGSSQVAELVRYRGLDLRLQLDDLYSCTLLFPLVNILEHTPYNRFIKGNRLPTKPGWKVDYQVRTLLQRGRKPTIANLNELGFKTWTNTKSPKAVYYDQVKAYLYQLCQNER